MTVGSRVFEGPGLEPSWATLPAQAEAVRLPVKAEGDRGTLPGRFGGLLVSFPALSLISFRLLPNFSF